MEQRNDEQRRGLQRRCRLGRRRRRRIGAATPRHEDVLQVGDRLAVRERRALRLTGRARRVEDREEVVLVDGASGSIARVAGRDQLGARPGRRRRAASSADRRTRARARGAPATASRDRSPSASASQISTLAPESRDRTRAPRSSTTRSAARRPRPDRGTPRTCMTHSDVVAPRRARPDRRGRHPARRASRDHPARQRVVLAEGVAARSPCTSQSTSAARVALRHELAQRASCAACRPAVGTPRTSSTTISNGPPGPVSWARTGSAGTGRRLAPAPRQKFPGNRV